MSLRTPDPLSAFRGRDLGTRLEYVYLHNMITSGQVIILLEEHWLWPYELSKLESVHPTYDVEAQTGRCMVPINLTPEYLKHSGPIFMNWFCHTILLATSVSLSRFHHASIRVSLSHSS